MTSTSPPGRSELPTRASTRPGVACVACQAKKQKCDNGMPKCKNCDRANKACLSEDPATRRRYPRDYLVKLEKRVEYLEASLEESRSEVSTNASNQARTRSQSTTTGSEPERHPQPTYRQSHHGDIQTTRDPDDLGIAMLCINSASGEPQFFGSSSVVSFSKVVSSTIRSVRYQAPGLSMGGVSEDVLNSQPSITPPAHLPDRATGNTLSEAYFSSVNTQFPFLHQPTFRIWEENVRQGIEGFQPTDSRHLYFVYMVYAVGALVSPYSTVQSPEGLYAAAEGLLEGALKLHGLEAIQAILCCAMYSIRSSVGASIWSLSGLALRQCIELGLHRNIRWLKRDMDPLREQMRCRVFWCAYNLDRAAATTLGRPLGIADRDVNVEYPLDINDHNVTAGGLLCEPRQHFAEPPTSISAAIHVLRQRRIWARFQEKLSSDNKPVAPSAAMATVSELRQELDDWIRTIPPPFVVTTCPSDFGTSEWFTLSYHHSLVLLYHRGLMAYQDSTSEPIEADVESLYMECATAAQNACQLYRQMYLSQRISGWWGSLHILFLCGLTFVHCLWASKQARVRIRRDEVAQTCTSCSVVLALMADRWPAAQPFRDTFDILASATHTMLVEADQPSAQLPSLPILDGNAHDQLPGYLNDVADVGMNDLVEHLLERCVNG